MSWLSKIVALLLMLGLIPNLYAADSINLLVMVDDADKESVPRNDRINKRIQASISQQLNHIAEVYDENSIGLINLTQKHVRRTDAELLEIARSSTRPPIDIIAIISTFAGLNSNDQARNGGARIEGRLLNAKSGQFLDNVEVQSPNSWSLPRDCQKQTCINEEISEEAKLLGDELAVILAKKLNWLVNENKTELSNDYYLEFDGFSAQDVASIEEYLLLFSGYVSHRPIQQRYTRTTLLYRSSISTAKLSRNILKLLDELSMRASISFKGNSFNLKRITLRGEQPVRDIADGW